MNKSNRRDRRRTSLLLILAMIIALATSAHPAHGDCPECYEPNPNYDPDNPSQSEPPCIKVDPRTTKTFGPKTIKDCDPWTEVRVLIDTKVEYGPWSEWTVIDIRCSGSDDPRSNPSITIRFQKQRIVKTTTVEEVFNTRMCKIEHPCIPAYYIIESTPAERQTTTKEAMEFEYMTRTWTPYNFENPDQWFAFWHKYCS